MEKVFRGIWYRHQPPKRLTFDDAFDRDNGKLVITDGGLKYNGKKNQFEIPIDQIESLEFGPQGSDFINGWIKIQHSVGDESRTALFADGKLFAYSGVFGGTKRIFNALRRLTPLSKIRRVDNSHVKVQLLLLVILIVFVLKLLYF